LRARYDTSNRRKTHHLVIEVLARTKRGKVHGEKEE